MSTFISIMNCLKKNTIISIILFAIIGLGLRISVSNYGYNHDFIHHQKNMEFLKYGESFYAYGKYNYTPLWVNLLLFLDTVSLPFINYQPSFRIKLVLLLSLVDFLIFILLCRNYSIRTGLLFFLNPISIFITGFHNQFDNIAILLAFVAILIYEKYKNNYELLISLIIFGLSICAKHVLIFFPIWLAFKEKLFTKKIIIILVPYLIFFLSFVNYVPEDLNPIIKYVFQYKASNNGPFWKIFTPQIIYIYIDQKILFFIVLIIIGLFFKKKSLRNIFYYYLILIVILSSGMANQYLAIPLLALAIFWNRKYLIYSLLCVLLFVVDGDAFNIQVLREFLEWDYRSTRMMYYPIILILLLGFLETILGKKKLSLFFLKIVSMIINKIKT